MGEFDHLRCPERVRITDGLSVLLTFHAGAARRHDLLRDACAILDARDEVFTDDSLDCILTDVPDDGEEGRWMRLAQE